MCVHSAYVCVCLRCVCVISFSIWFKPKRERKDLVFLEDLWTLESWGRHLFADVFVDTLKSVDSTCAWIFCNTIVSLRNGDAPTHTHAHTHKPTWFTFFLVCNVTWVGYWIFFIKQQITLLCFLLATERTTVFGARDVYVMCTQWTVVNYNIGGDVLSKTIKLGLESRNPSITWSL